MSQTVLFSLFKDTTMIKELEIENAPIPRIGEVIHLPGSAMDGMDWYLTTEVLYTIKKVDGKNTVSVIVTGQAASSHPSKGIRDHRVQLMHTDGWVSTDLAPEED